MEIDLIRDKSLSPHDTGGGVRVVKATIIIDENLPPRMQRRIAIYETLGCCLGYVLPHDQIENLSDALMDVFDELEPI